MEHRVALLGIVIENLDSVEILNNILHQYNPFIIGRMGIPYRAKNLHLISIAIDAPLDTLNTIAGKLGRLPGVRVKTTLASSSTADDKN